jgi:ATP-dependent Clp protease ATP-binding subunit ClpA
MNASVEGQLDPERRSTESRDFEAGLRRKIVGQDEAVQAVVEATAELLFGDPRAVIKVDCAEFQHSHEIAKLIGSPPGYLGHRETHPLITQEALAQYHTEKLKISFLLFDEIEKASDALWQLLLGILDKATLTLGDNRRVDLSQTMIFMTSNLGGVEITELMTGGVGFAPLQRAETKMALDEKVEKTASEAAKRKFAPEFMYRIDKTVCSIRCVRRNWNRFWKLNWGWYSSACWKRPRTIFVSRDAAGTGISA